MAMPRATARPWTEKVMVSPPGRPKAKRGPLGRQRATRSGRTWGPSLLTFSEFVGDEGEERVHRFLFALADGFDRHLAAIPGGQHHHAHDALGVDAPLSPGEPHLTR